MTDTGQPKLVKALFNFKGQNNDELCFVKGDEIMVTQVVEGGWWEGTLRDKTGWFPSNYVKDVKPDGRTDARSPTVKSQDMVLSKRDSMVFYHNVVLESLVESERIAVTQLQTLLKKYIRPLQGAGVLSAQEYVTLVGNLEDIASLHHGFLAALEECSKLPVPQQRVGGVFMKWASRLKALYSAYCANHPQAVVLLQKRRDELNKFMENQGASQPGIMSLTTSLSNPFTRLEKYPSVLKELERHTEESHVDRGDTQRAISVYKEIVIGCTEVRKHKEVEYDIMTSSIKAWEGEDINQLGEVLLLSHVSVHSEQGDRREHIMLLFPGIIVLLSISPRLSGYVFQGKFPVYGTTVNSLEETDSYSNAFEIMGNLIDRRVVSCATKHEQTQWVEMLKQQATQPPNLVSSKPQSIQISTSQPSISTLTKAKTAMVSHQPPNRPHRVWTMSCLRPTPPIRPSVFLKEEHPKSPHGGRKANTMGRRKPVDDSKTLEEDALILRVIEAYCTSAKARHTVNSSLLDNPNVLIAEEEKIIVEHLKGNQTVVEEKTLVDTVYSLKDQVKDLRQEHKRMRKDLEEEKKARKKLENMIRKSLRSLAEHSWEENVKT